MYFGVNVNKVTVNPRCGTLKICKGGVFLVLFKKRHLYCQFHWHIRTFQEKTHIVTLTSSSPCVCAGLLHFIIGIYQTYLWVVVQIEAKRLICMTCFIPDLKSPALYKLQVLLNPLCEMSLFTKREPSLIFSSLKKSSFLKLAFLLNFEFDDV